MKRSRKRILLQIGAGTKVLSFSRVKQPLKVVHTTHAIRTLKGANIVPPEFLEEAKKKIAYDFAKALFENNFIKWELDDEYDPVLRGRVRIAGILRVAEPPKDGEGI